MDNTRETRYFVVKGNLYELAVNFTQMTYNLYLIDPESTLETIITDKVLLANNLTANGHITGIEMTRVQKMRMANCCTGLSRQILNNLVHPEKSAVISYYDDYESAYKKWKETRKEDIRRSMDDIRECTLDTVILDDDTKKEILRTINFVAKHEEFLEMGCELPSGILLEGDPGCGKTLIAKTIAKESGVNYKGVVASDLIQKYVGDSSKSVGSIFDDLAKDGGGVLFIDEIDAIGVRRTGADNKEYRNAFNKLLDCMASASERNIIVICATNLVEQLDPALIREGRIDKVLNIPLPDFDCRIELFKLYVNKLKHEDDFDYLTLAEMTEGKSGAFISTCCNLAGISAVYDGCKKTSYKHLLKVLDRKLNNSNTKKTNTIGFI